MEKKLISCFIALVVIGAIIGGLKLHDIRYYNLQCRNEEYLSMLSDDTKTDFILLDTYFCLPCPLSDFEQQGWVIEAPQRVLPARSKMSIKVTKGEREDWCELANLSYANIDVSDATVVRMRFGFMDMNDITYGLFGKRGNEVIIKRGINLCTADSKMRDLLTDMEGFDGTPYLFMDRTPIRVWKDDICRIRISSHTNNTNQNIIVLSVISDKELNALAEAR